MHEESFVLLLYCKWCHSKKSKRLKFSSCILNLSHMVNRLPVSVKKQFCLMYDECLHSNARDVIFYSNRFRLQVLQYLYITQIMYIVFLFCPINCEYWYLLHRFLHFTIEANNELLTYDTCERHVQSILLLNLYNH